MTFSLLNLKVRNQGPKKIKINNKNTNTKSDKVTLVSLLLNLTSFKKHSGRLVDVFIVTLNIYLRSGLQCAIKGHLEQRQLTSFYCICYICRGVLRTL